MGRVGRAVEKGARLCPTGNSLARFRQKGKKKTRDSTVGASVAGLVSARHNSGTKGTMKIGEEDGVGANGVKIEMTAAAAGGSGTPLVGDGSLATTGKRNVDIEFEL